MPILPPLPRPAAALACVLAAALGAGPAGPRAPAEPVLFFGEDWEGPADFPTSRAARDAFLAGLGERAEEDFEGRAGRILRLDLGGYGALLRGGAKDSVSSVVRGAPGRVATSARRYYEHGSDLLVIELGRAVEAVGFHAIDVGDAGGVLRVTVSDASGGWERSYPVPHRVVPRGDGRGDGAVLFFGLVAPGVGIRRIELRNVGAPGDGFGYDDLVVGRVRRAAVE